MGCTSPRKQHVPVRYDRRRLSGIYLSRKCLRAGHSGFYKFSLESRMLRKALILLFVSLSIASWVSCGTTQSHFVYATVSAANQIIAYREDPNSGVLTAVAGSPYPTGTSPQSVVLHPSKNFLYVANSGDNDLSLFTIAAGALTEVAPRTVTGTTPSLLAVDSAGSFLYVGNA